jgi:DNA end-binding protein Ku
MNKVYFPFRFGGLMRAMWTGSVAFGLVNVPIKLYSATEDHDVRFHQVHAADGGRVKMVRTCSVDGARLETKDLSKAYEADTGRVVVMTDEDFEGLPVPGVKEIAVLEFVPSEQVDPILFDRSYYLEPEPRALKPYVLLREALQQTERTAIVRVVLRTKTQLAALRVRDDVLVLQTMLWPDEVRAADFGVLEGDADVRPQELTMAASFIESLSADFDPSQYRDDYREALLGVIDRKLSGGEVLEPAGDVAASEGDGIVLDLMTALRESVRRTQAAKEDAVGTAAVQKAPRKPRATAASKADVAPPMSKSASTSKASTSRSTKSTDAAPAKTTTKRAATATATDDTAVAKKSTRRTA